MARAERAHVEAGWLGTVWGAFADKTEAFVAESASHTELLVSGVLKERVRGPRHTVGVGALGKLGSVVFPVPFHHLRVTYGITCAAPWMSCTSVHLLARLLQFAVAKRRATQHVLNVLSVRSPSGWLFKDF
jgi:hypothetical protein